MAQAAFTEPRYISHPDPVWREQSNFLLHAQIGPEAPNTFEQLWARRVGEDLFEICCIPFVVEHLSLGDVVCGSINEDGHYLVGRVADPSRRSVYRVRFGRSPFPRERIANKLVGLGALLEWYSPNLLAVDALPRRAPYVAAYLQQHERIGHLLFETCRPR